MRPVLGAILVTCISICQAQYAQPDIKQTFNDDYIPTYNVYIDTSHLNFILAEENKLSKVEFPADVFISYENHIDTLLHVGFRLRGNTSRSAGKKSFKIAIDAFEDKRDYQGLEKINLNGEHNDPSIIRSKLGWELARQANALGSRANHVKLYINEEYRGLYINVEHIDEEYVELRFDNKNGNLYKCLWPASLSYLGDNPDLYKFENGDRRAYEEKRNEDLDDYTDLAKLIAVLALSDEKELVPKLEAIFDTESYLRALAVEILAGHWDNYSINQNNYYLYHNEADDKLYYILYDLDNTFGIDWFGQDWAEFSLFQWFYSDQDRPLIKRMMEVPRYRIQLAQIVDELLKHYYSPETLFPKIDSLQEQIFPAVISDQYRKKDYGFSITDFENSFDQSLPDHWHVRYGLKEFIQRRYETAKEQVEIILGMDLNQKIINLYPNPTTEYVHIQAEHPMSMEVMDMQGKVISSKHLSMGTNQFHIGDLNIKKAGVYFAVFKQEGLLISTQRLVIQ
ncbi:MAG: CotH kinase family protein [Cyclobacteriaceae bacterium]